VKIEAEYGMLNVQVHWILIYCSVIKAC